MEVNTSNTTTTFTHTQAVSFVQHRASRLRAPLIPFISRKSPQHVAVLSIVCSSSSVKFWITSHGDSPHLLSMTLKLRPRGSPSSIPDVLRTDSREWIRMGSFLILDRRSNFSVAMDDHIIERKIEEATGMKYDHEKNCLLCRKCIRRKSRVRLSQ